MTSAGPNRKFLRKITLVAVWGQGLDGYDLGVISVALPFIIKDQNVSATWAGLIGASSLIGIFFGGPLFGWFTDKTGRRVTFTVDLAIFLAAAVAQTLTTDIVWLFFIRFVLGLAIGAEYSIGAPMLAEFSPTEGRGRRISGLEVSWYVGYVISVAISYGLFQLGWQWHYVLATGAVPALICLILRRGVPESPRWLMSQGRTDEARGIIDEYLGGEEFFNKEEFEDEQSREGKNSYGILFAPGQRSNTIFACAFYMCLVAPYFAIFTFAPVVQSSLHLTQPAFGTIAINAVAAIGALAGMFAIERLGRRQLLIGPFWISAAALFVIGVWGGAPTAVIVICFMLFAFFNAVSSDLTPVYPNELFPTAVRTTGAGLATAASRVSAAVGTFLLPIGLETIGVGATMIIAAVICAIGAVLSQWLAPETTGVTLTRTSSLRGPRVKEATSVA